MSDKPWERNSGKFDRPSSEVPSVTVQGDGPLADRLRQVFSDDDRFAYCGVEPVSAAVSDVEAPPEVEAVDGEVEGGAADGSLPTKLSPDIFRGLVSEAERLIEMRRDIALQMKAVRDAAKDRGVNVKAFNELLRRREMDARVRDDFDHSLAIYETVAGLSRGVIDRGELVRQPALAAPGARGISASKTKAELGAWLSGGLG